MDGRAAEGAQPACFQNHLPSIPGVQAVREMAAFDIEGLGNRPEEDGGLGQLPTDEAVVGAVDLREGLFQEAGPELVGIATCEEEELGGEPFIYDDLPPLPLL